MSSLWREYIALPHGLLSIATVTITTCTQYRRLCVDILRELLSDEHKCVFMYTSATISVIIV